MRWYITARYINRPKKSRGPRTRRSALPSLLVRDADVIIAKIAETPEEQFLDCFLLKILLVGEICEHAGRNKIRAILI